MREIKFRGKEIETNKWVYGLLAKRYKCIAGRTVYVYIIQAETILNGITELKEYEVIPNTIGQYDGQKDKNNIEIYEGDILENNYGGNSLKNNLDRVIDEIVYEGNMFTYKNCMRWSLGNDEIIGNKHDNPELLEGRL